MISLTLHYWGQSFYRWIQNILDIYEIGSWHQQNANSNSIEKIWRNFILFKKKKRVYDGFLPISGKPLKSTMIEKPAVYKYEIFKNKYCTTENLSENYLSWIYISKRQTLVSVQLLCIHNSHTSTLL